MDEGELKKNMLITRKALLGPDDTDDTDIYTDSYFNDIDVYTYSDFNYMDVYADYDFGGDLQDCKIIFIVFISTASTS